MEPLRKPAVASSPYKYGKTYLFRIRQHSGDNFSSLWDLDQLGRSGDVMKVIAQADNLNIALENMQGELESDGL